VPVIYRLIFLLLLIGCGKAPQPVSVANPEPTSASSSASDFSGINSGESPPQQLSQATPAASQTPAAIFRSAAANDALERYTAARAAVKEVPAPTLINSSDPLANRAAVTGYINTLSQRLDTLKAEQTAVQQNLDPDERKRFRQLEKSLDNPDQ
jgi:hypothetical protein